MKEKTPNPDIKCPHFTGNTVCTICEQLFEAELRVKQLLVEIAVLKNKPRQETPFENESLDQWMNGLGDENIVKKHIYRIEAERDDLVSLLRRSKAKGLEFNEAGKSFALVLIPLPYNGMRGWSINVLSELLSFMGHEAEKKDEGKK